MSKERGSDKVREVLLRALDEEVVLIVDGVAALKFLRVVGDSIVRKAIGFLAQGLDDEMRQTVIDGLRGYYRSKELVVPDVRIRLLEAVARGATCLRISRWDAAFLLDAFPDDDEVVRRLLRVCHRDARDWILAGIAAGTLRQLSGGKVPKQWHTRAHAVAKWRWTCAEDEP